MMGLSMRGNEDAIIRWLQGYEPRKAKRIVKRYREFFEQWLKKIRNNTCPVCGRTFATRQRLLMHLYRSKCREVLVDIARRILEGEDPEVLSRVLVE